MHGSGKGQKWQQSHCYAAAVMEGRPARGHSSEGLQGPLSWAGGGEPWLGETWEQDGRKEHGEREEKQSNAGRWGAGESRERKRSRHPCQLLQSLPSSRKEPWCQGNGPCLWGPLRLHILPSVPPGAAVSAEAGEELCNPPGAGGHQGSHSGELVDKG